MGCRGLVFAEPSLIEFLARRGHLTLCDSTHNLSKWTYNDFFPIPQDVAESLDIL
jgi:hypothetical protein